MKLLEAEGYAKKYLDMLKPYCKRIEIAGSVLRKKKEDIKDIEIVLIPDNSKLVDLKIQIEKWRKIKGIFPCKYTQRITEEGIKLDIFITTKEQWGLILAIRIGSADYSHNVLAAGWVKAGYHSSDGWLIKDGKKIPIYEEEELFKLIGVDYCEPEKRIWPKA